MHRKGAREGSEGVCKGSVLGIIYYWNLLNIMKFSVVPGVSNLVLNHLNYACKFVSFSLCA